MRLNQNPNFRVEDFPSEQSWIGKLFVQLNPFIQAVNQLLNLNVDFSANIKSVSKEYAFSTFQPFSFLWPYTDLAPSDVRITKAVKGIQKTPTILLAAWSFDAATQQIRISQ